MSRSINSNSEKNWRLKFFTLKFRFAILILIFVSSLQTFAQMGSGYTYSDMWFDNSVGALSVVGSAVTDESYNTYNHEAWVYTTFTSPTGETVMTNSGQQGGGGYGTYAQADSVLLVGEGGDFSLLAEYGYFCPIAFRDTNLGTTTLTIPVVLSSYRKELPSGDYVPTCCSPCTIIRVNSIFVNAPFIECGLFYNQTTRDCYGGSIIGLGLCTNLTAPGRCRPDTGRQPPTCQ